MPKNLRFSTIFSNSTISKITFVALRRFMCHRHVVNVIYVVCRFATLVLLLCWLVCFLYILSFYGLLMQHAFSQPQKEISLELTLIVVIIDINCRYKFPLSGNLFIYLRLRTLPLLSSHHFGSADITFYHLLSSGYLQGIFGINTAVSLQTKTATPSISGITVFENWLV